MSHNERGVVALFVVLLIIAGVFLYQMTGETIKGSDTLLSNGAPDYETAPQSLFDEDLNDVLYHFAAPHHIRNATYCRHRYPKYAGHNITMLIHKGFAPMMKAARCNPQWVDNPPAQMDGYSI